MSVNLIQTQAEITRLQNAKSDLIAQIEAKGVAVPDNATLDELSSLVAQISQGEAPTQFTNLFDGHCFAKQGYVPTTSGWSARGNSGSLIIPIPSDDSRPVLRLRGIFEFLGAAAHFFLTNSADGSGDMTVMKGVNHNPNSSFFWYYEKRCDEHGDVYFTLKNDGGFSYVIVPFYTDYMSNFTSNDVAFKPTPQNLKITINEPIGNGGYAG